MSKFENVCKYCGDKFSSKSKTADMCHKCYEKLPLVRKLVAIGKQIKGSVEK